MNPILLTGKSGQVGWELQTALAPLGHVIAPDHADMDLADPDALRAVVRETRPSVIVNAAAYTAVDTAEVEPARRHRSTRRLPKSWRRKPNAAAPCSSTTRPIMFLMVEKQSRM